MMIRVISLAFKYIFDRRIDLQIQEARPSVYVNIAGLNGDGVDVPHQASMVSVYFELLAIRQPHPSFESIA